MYSDFRRALIRLSWKLKPAQNGVAGFLGGILIWPVVVLTIILLAVGVLGSVLSARYMQPMYIVESFICVASPALGIGLIYSLYLLWKKRFRGFVWLFLLWAMIGFVGNIYGINMLADTSQAQPKLAEIILDYGPQCGRASHACVQVVLPDRFPLPFHLTDNESVFGLGRYNSSIKMGITKAILLTHKGVLGLPWYESASAQLTDTNTIPANLEIPTRGPLWLRLLYLVISVGGYVAGLVYYKAPAPLSASKYPENGFLTGFTECTFTTKKLPYRMGICLLAIGEGLLIHASQTKATGPTDKFFFFLLIVILAGFILYMFLCVMRDVPRLVVQTDGIRQINLSNEQWVHWSSTLPFRQEAMPKGGTVVSAQIIGDKISPNLRERRSFMVMMDFNVKQDDLIARLNKIQENYFRAHPEEKRDMRVSKI